ncbi:HAMP domain-containing sensor histidine kinase [Mucilaginibacter sp.]|uniref:sensor histidine kinase n=1 Tax=Mucilaginibacter sp. TaxID=1882438 RepID=UPI00260B9A78|nr:HAMP domain-containing sensor histidine kinase [Mucilaginibacter sp.]MDB5030121.1 phoR 1 [Mucilaginibacter sp.]
MSFALIGVVAMQLYFLMQSYNMQSTLFDRSVNEALSNVVAKLSRQDAYNFLMNKAQPHTTRPKTETENQIIEISDKRNTHTTKAFINKDSIRKQAHRQRKLNLLRDSLKHMLMRQRLDELESDLQVRIEGYTDEFGIMHGRLTPILKNPAPRTTKSNQKLEKYTTLHFTYIDPQFGEQLITQKVINPLWLQEQERIQKQNQLDRVKKMLATDSLQNLQANKPNVIQNVYDEYQRSGEPLKKRINNPYWVDTLLRMELHNQGIDLPFSYEVSTTKNDSVIFSTAMDKTGARPIFMPADTYHTQIFKEEVINDPGMIKLSFPKKNSSILSKMTTTLATTGGLLFILVSCFGYTLFSIIRQKKISEMRTDFINNMTHEFKTPVSTIMIASEALRDNEIVADKNRISRLANIIYEENERLGSHIERVLNIARIDKNDFKLDKKPIDVNEMISVVVDSMELKLQKCNADVSLDLQAENAIINADELHFSNVLYNLIDNAIKYSESAPQITISTQTKNGQVFIKVADKGIGMSRDQQIKIFEQFYRIPTGNVHNVKGFGLGLSYVNTIVKRLNGTINVRSEKDKGSEFELKFQGA